MIATKEQQDIIDSVMTKVKELNLLLEEANKLSLDVQIQNKGVVKVSCNVYPLRPIASLSQS